MAIIVWMLSDRSDDDLTRRPPPGDQLIVAVTV
jgi:hypothetical protein